MAGNGSLIPETAGIIQTVLPTSLTEDGETGEYSVLDSPGKGPFTHVMHQYSCPAWACI